MAQWFRFYAEVLNDAKVQKLDGDTFKAWVNLLCIASENDGKFPDDEALAFAMRMDNNACRTVVERLLNATLIDRVNGGANGWHYAPHSWAKRQYKSDTSTDRVKRFRQRSKTVSETAPDTDTDTDILLSKDNSVFDIEKVFWSDAKTFLSKSGKTERQAGALVGKWLRDHGKELTRAAISAAQTERAVDPIAYVEAFFRRNSGVPKARGSDWQPGDALC